MPSSFTIGRIAGIKIGVNYTWLFIFFLVAWSLAVGYFPYTFPFWGTATYWIVGFISAFLLFVAVLIHELMHSLVAKAQGLDVESITLFIFGGVSNLKGEPKSAKSEFLIAVVGPVTSLVLAGIFWGILQALPSQRSPLAGILGYLALINLLLGLFNLLPGFPLDGGRVLRSIIWGISGSMMTATRIASYVGQAIGFLLIAWGVFQLFTGAFLNGLWIAFIGWFLNNAAESIRHAQQTQESLRGVQVGEVMDRRPATIGPDRSVADFIHEDVLQEGKRAALVEDQGRLVGIVSLTDAKKVSQDDWPTTAIASIMTRDLKTVTPDTDVTDALPVLVNEEINQVPVVKDGQVVGLLSRADLLRYLQTRQDLGIHGGPAEAPRREAGMDGRGSGAAQPFSRTAR